MGKTELEVGRKPRKKRTRLPDDALPHAIKHWIKLQALIILHDGEFTSGEIAEMIGEDVKLVSGHIRDLYNSGRIEVADFKMVGNHKMAIYRAIELPYVSREEYMRMSLDERHDATGIVLQSLLAELLASFRGGKMDDDEDMAIVFQDMSLDAQGKEELLESQMAFWEKTRDIRARAVNRMAKSGEEGTITIAAFLGFIRGRSARLALGRKNSEKNER